MRAMDSKAYSILSPRNLSDRNKLQEFVRDASPAEWLEYAEELEELHDSAELLWRNEAESLRVEVALNAEYQPVDEAQRISGISRTYMLLAGFALENVLKGLLVAADPSHVNTGKLSPELKSHDT